MRHQENWGHVPPATSRWWQWRNWQERLFAVRYAPGTVPYENAANGPDIAGHTLHRLQQQMREIIARRAIRPAGVFLSLLTASLCGIRVMGAAVPSNLVSFTTSGQYAPSPGLIAALVTGQAAGGSGGTATSAATSSVSGGNGGNGSSFTILLSAAQIGAGVPVTVGQPSSAGGSATSFGTFATALGGAVGMDNASTTTAYGEGGLGGQASIAPGIEGLAQAGAPGSPGYSAAPPTLTPALTLSATGTPGGTGSGGTGGISIGGGAPATGGLGGPGYLTVLEFTRPQAEPEPV